MGVSAAVFQSAGQRSDHWVPGAYSRSASVGSNAGDLSAGNGVILGKSTGGQPHELYSFSTVGEAREVLVDGELLKAVAHAFNPGSLGGAKIAPQRIFAMRVNPGTQAGRALKSGGTTVLNLKSYEYGVHMNQLKMQLTSGTNPGTKKVLFAYKSQSDKIDNIGKKSISLQYTGAGSAATVAVTNDNMTITVECETADSLTLAFEDFPTIDEIVTRLNDTGHFVAVQLDQDSNVPANELDAVNALDIKASAQVLKSDFYALIHALNNSYYIGAGNVAKAEGVANAMPDEDGDFVYFEGATAGTYTVDDWVAALEKLEAENIQIVSTPSTDFAVAVLISNHCTAMSNVVNRKERTYFVGGPIGETIDQAIEKAGQLNNKLGRYCYPWINSNSPITGEAEDLPASYYGCKLLGMESAFAVNEPLTNKSVDVNKFGKKLKTTEMEKLIIGGVLCGGFNDENRLVTIRAITTNQGNMLQDCESSMVREDLFMNRDIRQQYSKGVGRPGVDKGSAAKSILLLAAKGWKGEGLIVPNDDGDNVWGVIVRKSGDATYIEFNRNLTAPQNFFFITAYNYVYESKTEVSV